MPTAGGRNSLFTHSLGTFTHTVFIQINDILSIVYIRATQAGGQFVYLHVMHSIKGLPK